MTVCDPEPPHPLPRKPTRNADGCHLCERARSVLVEAGVAFEEVDVTGDEELEARYREWLPVVEIDGKRAFVYYVDPGALRRKLAARVQGEGTPPDR